MAKQKDKRNRKKTLLMDLQKVGRYRDDAERGMIHYKFYPENQKDTRTGKKYKNAYRRYENLRDQ